VLRDYSASRDQRKVMRTLTQTLTLTIALATALAGPLAAETIDHSAHAGHASDAAMTAATEAFIAANDRMHAGMAITYTGNADVDFVRGMIAHHQGAVDAARIVLDHGSDPAVRSFAEGVIAAQEAEIAWMQAWLAENAP
jgi:uncharacterized protein (DUF305 family)